MIQTVTTVNMVYITIFAQRVPVHIAMAKLMLEVANMIFALLDGDCPQ